MMNSSMRPFFLLLSAALCCAPANARLFGNSCTKIETPDDFDVDKYIEKSWYIQRQQTNTYQPEDDLYCIVATYSKEGERQWGRRAITVRNYANSGAVNGPSPNGDFKLCATPRFRFRKPAELRVAPCYVPASLGGDYWVVAFDPDYEWAIVTAGQPDQEGACSADSSLCTLREECKIGFLPCVGNGQGLWFFTQAQSPDPSIIDAMEAKALELGICTANMRDVVHEGCNYDGATLK
jgi:lipocalin